MTQCTVFQFQTTTQPQEIIDYLVDGVSTNEEGVAFMTTLIEKNPTLANQVLCQFFDIACYKIGDSCFSHNHPIEEQELWFVSSPEDFQPETLNGNECEIPLGKSEQEAQCIAVKYLKLKEIFFSNQNND